MPGNAPVGAAYAVGFAVLGIPVNLNRFLFLASRLPHPVPSQGLDSQRRHLPKLVPHLVHVADPIRGQSATGLV